VSKELATVERVGSSHLVAKLPVGRSVADKESRHRTLNE